MARLLYVTHEHKNDALPQFPVVLNIVTQRMATANCKLKVSHHRDGPKFSLEATTTINAHEEILWSYGADYEYPDKYPEFTYV